MGEVVILSSREHPTFGVAFDPYRYLYELLTTFLVTANILGTVVDRPKKNDDQYGNQKNIQGIQGLTL